MLVEYLPVAHSCKETSRLSSNQLLSSQRFATICRIHNKSQFYILNVKGSFQKRDIINLEINIIVEFLFI